MLCSCSHKTFLHRFSRNLQRHVRSRKDAYNQRNLSLHPGRKHLGRLRRAFSCALHSAICGATTAIPIRILRGNKKSLGEILDAVAAYRCSLVEITGGEPLLQKNVLPLMSMLCDSGHTVLLETSGAHDISKVDPRVHRIMDLKPRGAAKWTRIFGRTLTTSPLAMK